MSEPRTQAGRDLLTWLTTTRESVARTPDEHVDAILAIEAEARALEHDRLAHVAWAQDPSRAEALPSVERLARWIAQSGWVSNWGIAVSEAESFLAALRHQPTAPPPTDFGEQIAGEGGIPRAMRERWNR